MTHHTTQAQHLLIEAIDQEQMKKVLKALSFMRKIDFSSLPTINNAVKSAIDELNTSLTKDSGIITKTSDVVSRAFAALKTRSTAPLKTPVGKAIDIASTVTNGFAAMPSIIDANVRDPSKVADKPLSDAVTAKAEIVQKLIQKAFASKSNLISAEKIAEDMMHVKLRTIADIAKRIKTDVGARDSFELISKAIQTQQTKVQNPKATKKPTEPEKTTPTKGTTGTTPSNTARSENLDVLKKIQKDSGLDEATFSKALQAIIKHGYTLSKKSAPRAKAAA